MDDPIIERVKIALLCGQRCSWEQGTAAIAFYELHHPASPTNSMIVNFAYDSITRTGKDGRVATQLNHPQNENAQNDPFVNLECLHHAYEITGDKKYVDAIDRHLQLYMKHGNKTADGVYSHLTDKCELWSDGMFMSPPVMLQLSKLHPELKAEAIAQVRGLQKYLQDPETKLWWHVYSADSQKFLRKLFWGVGIGWVCSGITRMVLYLQDSTEKDYLLALVKETLDAALGHINSDGSFHDIIDDKSTFKEFNLSQQLSYTIYRLMAKGYLPIPKYLTTAEKLESAARNQVNKWGYIHPVCGSPNFDAPGTASEGQSFFLLMEAAKRDFEGTQPLLRGSQ